MGHTADRNARRGGATRPRVAPLFVFALAIGCQDCDPTGQASACSPACGEGFVCEALVCVSESLAPWTDGMPGRGAQVVWFDGAYLAAGLEGSQGAVVVGDPLSSSGASSLTTTARGPRLSASALDGEGVSLAWVDEDGFYRVASRESGAPATRWSVDVVRSEMEEQTPSYTATSDFTLTRGAGGLRALVFRDARSGGLAHARSSGGPWTIEQVDDGADSTQRCGSGDVVAREPSATLEATTGDLYVAYHDGVCGALKVARRGDSSWTVETVDRGDALPNGARAITGRAPSVTLTSQGEVAVSYQDRTRGRLYYTRLRLGVWQRELVDRGDGVAQTGQRPKNIVGAFSSLTFDVNDAPTIAYFDSGAAATRLATRGATGAWSTDELDGDGLVGLFVSSARSPSGGVVVSERVVPTPEGLTSRMSVTRLEVDQ